MRISLATLLFLFILPRAIAQPQPENAGFETWTGLGTGTEEPAEWSSLKTSDGGSIINNFAPQVCWRSADAHSGGFSVRLKTANSLAGPANGTLTNGRVHADFTPTNGYVFTDPNASEWNQPLTSRPDSLVGWFKAIPVGNDRGKVEAILHVGAGRLPENGTLPNWVGRARWDAPIGTVGTWTRFSVPFHFFNATTPAWLLMVLTSGDSLVTLVDSESWYDDVALIYNVRAVPSTSVAVVTAVDPFALNVHWSTGGAPVAPTTFTVQLSNAAGSFASPVTIGSAVSSATSGTIACSIPAGTVPGTGYRIRVVTPSAFYAPVSAPITISNSVVRLAAKVFLDGPYDPATQTMGDGLRTAGLLPLAEPYTASGFALTAGGEVIQPAVLAAAGNNAIVDWVVVELRNKNNSANVIRARAALVQRDGDIVDIDGSSALPFGLAADQYFVAIRHRNHLGVMTASAIALSATPATVDLTLPATATFGTLARRTEGSRSVLWPGDVNGDGVVKYAGSGNDRDPILVLIGGTVPTATTSGYRREDVSMDGVVKYAGSGNDRDRLLLTIGGTVPTATRSQQLP